MLTGPDETGLFAAVFLRVGTLVFAEDLEGLQGKTGGNTGVLRGGRRTHRGIGVSIFLRRPDCKTTPPLFRARCQNSAVFGNFWTRWGVVHNARAHTRPHRSNSPPICPPQRASARNPVISSGNRRIWTNGTDTGDYIPERLKRPKNA